MRFFPVCPISCRCSTDGNGSLILDCSDSNLQRVPDIPDHVVVIDLKNNEISVLFNDSFENCTNVRKLDLSNNFGISVIGNIMLRGMPNLEEIVLNDMFGIRWNKQSFPDDAFENLTRLTSVSLQLLTRQYQLILTMTEFDFVMQKLPKSLVGLNVIIPVDGRFSEKLINFTRLRRLGIQNLSLRNGITITNDTFECLTNISLEALTIKSYNSHLSGIEPYAFYYLSKLKSLDMSGTSGISIADFYPALIGLRNTKIEILRLSSMQSIDDKFSLSVFLNDTFCENLALPYLVDLQMDHTQLFALSDICFKFLPNLKVLNLSFNSLSKGYLYRVFRCIQGFYKI